jgi:hypothetical protein
MVNTEVVKSRLTVIRMVKRFAGYDYCDSFINNNNNKTNKKTNNTNK